MHKKFKVSFWINFHQRIFHCFNKESCSIWLVEFKIDSNVVFETLSKIIYIFNRSFCECSPIVTTLTEQFRQKNQRNIIFKRRRVSFSNINLARKNRRIKLVTRFININFTKETLKLLWDPLPRVEISSSQPESRVSARTHTLNNLNFNRIKRHRTGVKTEKSWRDGKDSPILTVCTLKLFCSNAVPYDHRPLLTRASCLHDRVAILFCPKRIETCRSPGKESTPS